MSTVLSIPEGTRCLPRAATPYWSARRLHDLLEETLDTAYRERLRHSGFPFRLPLLASA
jgi:hypothetical protein